MSDTLLVYTTENGIMYGEHRLSMIKNVPYEEAIRSPFVARWDGHSMGRAHPDRKDGSTLRGEHRPRADVR